MTLTDTQRNARNIRLQTQLEQAREAAQRKGDTLVVYEIDCLFHACEMRMGNAWPKVDRWLKSNVAQSTD